MHVGKKNENTEAERNDQSRVIGVWESLALDRQNSVGLLQAECHLPDPSSDVHDDNAFWLS